MTCRPNIDQECQFIKPLIILKHLSPVGNLLFSIKNSKIHESNLLRLILLTCINTQPALDIIYISKQLYFSKSYKNINFFMFSYILYFSLLRGRGTLPKAWRATFDPLATGWETLPQTIVKLGNQPLFRHGAISSSFSELIISILVLIVLVYTLLKVFKESALFGTAHTPIKLAQSKTTWDTDFDEYRF